MEFLESIGSFLLLFVLPAITGALSGFVGIYLLFSFVRTIARWRGQRVAIVCTALLCGTFAFFTLFSTFMLGFSLALKVAFIGAFVGSVFAYYCSRTLKVGIAVTAILIGFLLGFTMNFYISFYIFRHKPTEEIYVLVFNLIFATVGGICGALSSGIYGAIREPVEAQRGVGDEKI